MGQKHTKPKQEHSRRMSDSFENLEHLNVEIDIESLSGGKTAQKLIENMWEYIQSPYTTPKDLKTFGDNAVRQGAAGKIKTYFDIFTEKLQNKFEPNSPEFDDFKRLLKVCVRYSEASVPFSEAIASTGSLFNLIDLLAIFQKSFKECFQTGGEIILSATWILYNCSLSSKNKSVFQDKEAVELIGWYANNTRGLNINGDNSLSTCFVLILAHTTDDEVKGTILRDDVITIFENLDGALSSPELRSSRGFTAKELTRGLTELANNNEYSRIICKSGAMARLMQLIEKGDIEDKIAAVKCIWVLVFVDENKNLLKVDPKVVQKLEQIKAESESVHSELRRAAGGALWELMDAESINHSQPVASTKTGDSPHVLISYSSEQRDIILKLKEFLEGNSYKVWIAASDMQGNALEAMAAAVKQAAVVLICMSQAYMVDQGCRSVAEYAYKTGKPIIPLRMQKGYNPKGWLDFIVGMNTCYNFAVEDMFDDSAEKLLKEIGGRGKQ